MFSRAMPRKQSEPPLESREFRSPEEIDVAITKLQRRIQELEQLDVKTAVLHHSGTVEVVRSNARETIRDVFGTNSTEYREHQYLQIWAGQSHVNMSDHEIVHGTELGRVHVIEILKGLSRRLEEKRVDLAGGVSPSPSTYFDRLNLHPRIHDVSHDLFLDGHPWEAVFAAANVTGHTVFPEGVRSFPCRIFGVLSCVTGPRC